MIEYSIFLIVAALAGGISAYFLPRVNRDHYRLGLIFGGSYLFAITIIHILPELFSQAERPGLLGVFVLAGFFLQQVLEGFTSGAEHGHLHEQLTGHRHTSQAIILLVLALSAHGLMEGALLSHPETRPVHEMHALLWGIVLHKGPAAFALVTILLCNGNRKVRAGILLAIFSLTSPAGLWAGTWLRHGGEAYLVPVLFALVSGSFLHISTTIVFESSDSHHLNFRRWGVSLAGALLAVLAELI